MVAREDKLEMVLEICTYLASKPDPLSLIEISYRRHIQSAPLSLIWQGYPESIAISHLYSDLLAYINQNLHEET